MLIICSVASLINEGRDGHKKENKKRIQRKDFD